MMLADLIVPSMPWLAVSVSAPLVAGVAAACLGAYSRGFSFVFAITLVIIPVLCAAQLLVHGPTDIVIGGWAPPLGIVLRLDGLSSAFLLATGIVSAVIVMFASPDFGMNKHGKETRRRYAFWPIVLFLLAGLNASFSSVDLFNLFVALELVTLCAVALVALEGSAAAIAAAIRYFLFAMLGSLAYLLGAAILFGIYGTLDVALLHNAVRGDAATLSACALLTAGLMAKMALFPLHAWLPAAHAAAPTPASALLSALVVKAPFVILLRLWFEVMPAVATPSTTQLLGALGAAGILLGSIMALRQSRLKLIVAYSTVAQLGYLFLVFPLAGGSGAEQPWTTGAWSGAIFHAIAHALAKSAMFLAVGVMILARGHDRLTGLSGIGRELPLATFAFGIAAISIMGLPPSGGFTGKYLLLVAAFASGQWWWAFAILSGGLLAAAYLFRPLNLMMSQAESQSARRTEFRRREILALFLAVLSILLGLLSAEPYALFQIGRPDAAMEGIS